MDEKTFLVLRFEVDSASVFVTLPNIYDRPFLKNSQ